MLLLKMSNFVFLYFYVVDSEHMHKPVYIVLHHFEFSFMPFKSLAMETLKVSLGEEMYRSVVNPILTNRKGRN